MLFIYAVLAAAVTAAGLELIARLWFRRFDRYLVLTPGQTAKITLDTTFFRALKSPVFHFINSDGERGDPVPREPDLYRILIVGGSAAICGLLDQSETFGARLQDALNAAEALALLGRRRVHVGCIAKSHVDTHAERLILERILPQYRDLDLLILMCGASDVLRWLGQGAPEGAPASRLSESNIFNFYPGAPFGWRPRKTALFAVYRRLRGLFHGTVALEDAGRTIRGEAAARAQAGRFVPLTQDPAAMLKSCRENMSAALRCAVSSARRVMVVRQPWWCKREFSPDEEARLWLGRIGEAENPPRFLSTASLYRLFSGMDSAIAEAAAAAGVPHIDLKPALENAPGAFYDHAHFTEAGALVAAQVVAAEILAPARASSQSVPHVTGGTA